MATERKYRGRYADSGEETQLRPGAPRQRPSNRSRSPCRPQSRDSRKRSYRDRSDYSYSVRSGQEKHQMLRDANKKASWRKADEYRSHNAERRDSGHRAVSDPTPSRRYGVKREHSSDRRVSSLNRRVYENEERTKPKNFTKPLTCFYWHHNGRCQKSDDDCYYAHFDTGTVASAPVNMGSNVVAGRSADAALAAVTEHQAALQRRVDALAVQEASVKNAEEQLARRDRALIKREENAKHDKLVREALDERERTLNQRQEEQSKHEQLVRHALNERERTLNQREEELTRQERSIQEDRLLVEGMAQRARLCYTHFNRMAQIAGDYDTHTTYPVEERNAVIETLAGAMDEELLRNIETWFAEYISRRVPTGDESD